MKYSIDICEKLVQLVSPVSAEIIQRESKMPIVKISAQEVRKVIQIAVSNPGLKFNFLNNISGTHLTEISEEGDIKSRGFALLYVLSRSDDFSSVVIGVDLPDLNPSVDSIDDIFGSANWFEREIYDLLGVVFNNSCDLRRIMLPDDWVGHPLRKDFQEKSSYNGIPTTREDELAAVRVDNL